MATATVQRGGTAGLVGGALWALLPVVFTVHLEDTARGTLAFVAVAAAAWVVGALSLVLLLVGLSRLRAGLVDGGGRLGAVGVVVSGLALLAMLVGNGTELATLTVSGTESDLGHSALLIGFLALVIGSLLLGIALLRGRREPLVRWAGALMAGMVPLGIGLGVLLNAVAPHTDLGFWAAITVPYGVAWVLLGRSLAASGRTRAAVVQEALTNVVRHAEARTACVRLAVDPESLTVEITDDGRGLPPDLVAGVGLSSMRERAAEMGGTCAVQAAHRGRCARGRRPPAGRGVRVVPLRVMVVEDHPLFRKGVVALLEAVPDFSVAGVAVSGEEAVARAARAAAGRRPDGSPAARDERHRGDPGDRRRPPGRAGARAQPVRGRGLGVPGAARRRPRLRAQGRRRGGADRGDPGRRARRGDLQPGGGRPRARVLRPAAAGAEGLPGAHRPGAGDPRADRAGHPNPSIARALFLSPKTVANYVSAIFAKLQVADRAEAMNRAREAGLGS